MRIIATALSPIALAVAALTATAASAEYRCAPPATRIDRLACEAAQQGPEALSRFIHRMRVVENLYFPDYVNEATLIAWEQKAQQEKRAKADSAPVRVADDQR